MAFNGSGTFLINTAGQPVVSGTVISSTAFNALTADLATGLSTAITKDGQTTVTANIPMSTYKFTGLGVGSAATDSANLSQVQSTVTKLLTSVSGADTITAVGAPVVAAYAAGQMFYFVATGDNTGAVTLNIDALGAKAVTRDGSVALVAGDIKSGEVVVVVYDGTRFQVVSQLNSAGNANFANVSITSALNVGGVATFSAGTAAAPSITTTGDTNTGIFFPAADTIAFTEGGVEAARFDSSGNFGIGTTSPQQKLHLVGNAYRQNDSTGSFGFTLNTTSSTTTLATLFGGSSFAIQTGGSGTNQLTLDSSGNLGIGTTSPGSKLDVNGEVRIYPSSSPAQLRFGVSATEKGKLSVDTSSNMAFETAGSERMRLDSSGNLGIGTSSPASKLHVSNTAAATRITITDDVASGRSGYIESNFSDALVIGTTSGVRGIRFSPDNTARMFLDTSGNLGIGTSSPVAKLSVQDASVPKFALQVGSTERAFLSYTESNFTTRLDSDGPVELAANNAVGLTISVNRNVSAGVPSLATSATDGFLYVPTCAGTPTGTPTAITGMAPIVVDTTNNKLYFYSTGVWRDAGP